MENIPEGVLRCFPTAIYTEAIANVCVQLQSNINDSNGWRSMHFLLSHSDETINSTSVFKLCLDYLESHDADMILVAEVLVLLIEKHLSEELKEELKKFLACTQSQIMSLMKSGNQAEGSSKSVSIVFSRILQPSIKANILEDTKNVEQVVISMVQSKQEKAIIEALAYLFPTITNSSLEAVFTNIKELFDDDNESYTSSNHPGLTALCSIADFIFTQTNLIQENKDWFCRNVQREISNLVALNRKRSQYLLKRYADIYPEKAALFNEFFLIVEALEEKQAHIILPVLTKVKALQLRIFDRKEEDPTWISCVYARILSHENLQIVKWGIQSLFEVKLDLWTGIGSNEWLHEAIFNGLNNISFYQREKPDELPKLADDLIDFMQRCSNLVNERCGFFTQLIKAMTKVSWNSVGLFHVALSLASIPSSAFLDGEVMQTFLEFLRGGLKTQYPVLRGAIAGLLVEFILKSAVISDPNLMWVTLMLSTLSEKECFIAESRVRNSLKSWLMESFNQSKLKEHLDNLLTLHFESSTEKYSVDVTSISRFVVLIEELIDEEAVKIIQKSLSNLEGCQFRLYADYQSIYSRLKLLIALINESKANSKVPASISKAVAPFIESSVLYCLDQIEKSTDYLILSENLLAIQSIASIPELFAPELERKIESIALKFIEVPGAISKFKSISLLSINPVKSKEVIQLIIERKMHCQSLEHCELTNATWGAFMSDYFSKLWSLIKCNLTNLLPKLNVDEFTEESINSMDFVGVEAVKSIFASLYHVLPEIVSSSLSLSTLNLCWTTCFEYRRSEHFWPLIEAFSRTVFQSKLLENETIRPLIFEFIADMKKHGENTLMLFNLPAETIVNQWMNHFPTVDELSVNFLANVLTFGAVHRRDEMILYETCSFVEMSKDKFSVNPQIRSENLADGQVRYHGLRFVLSLNKHEEAHLNMAGKLVETLLEQHRQLLKQKKRYFANSNGHRLKHRIWLSILILQDLLPTDGELQNEIFNQALTGLIDDNPQPSVRFLQEWTVMRLIYRAPKFEREFWKVMDDAVAQRVGSMVSFLSIVGHSAACLSPERLESFASNAIPRALPWAMAQHFTPRLYGAVVMDLLWNICQKSRLEPLLKQYELVRQLQKKAPEMPNAARNLEKLSQDFYFCLFHPLDSFTLETLCYHLPRLSHLTNEEWMPADWFDGVSSWIAQRNTDKRLAACQPADWVTRAAGGAPVATNQPEEQHETAVDNVQKKITPWKQMFPDLETLTLTAGRKKSKTNDLIVIASLIDRIPNLGGLCRTCEVLGVKDFAISTLKITEEKDFVSLSVSAERWMNMIEVKPHQLLDYIKELKLSGYTVVGAEQTAGSKPLNRFTFPKKTALLLGHEKEGIPVELIQHLDVCVEVPQEGIIRSMNVHVTGAIFIWEYVRQQLGI